MLSQQSPPPFLLEKLYTEHLFEAADLLTDCSVHDIEFLRCSAPLPRRTVAATRNLNSACAPSATVG
jgi:hypothetical protein